MTYIRAVLATVFSLLIIISPAVAFAQVATTTATTSSSVASAAPAIDPYNSIDVKTYLQNYFADVPVMVNIAKCESDFTQYDAAGTVLDGGSGDMLGVFQIDAAVHSSLALSLGDDITTLAGNAAYARYLYTLSGTQPWDSSKSCWGSAVVPAAKAVVTEVIQVATEAVLPGVTKAQAQTVASSSAQNETQPATQKLTQTLKLGSTGPQVLALEQILNADGFIISKKGAGSPGQETDTFGTLTQKALERFQCVQNIACGGTANTTGYGVAGAKTRAALMVK